MDTPVDDSDEYLPENEDCQAYTAEEEVLIPQRVFFTPDTLRVLVWAGILMLIYLVGAISHKIVTMRVLVYGANGVNGGQELAAKFLLMFLFVTFISGMTVHWFGVEWDSVDLSFWFSLDNLHNLMFNCTSNQVQDQDQLSLLEPGEECGMFEVMNHMLKLIFSAGVLLAVFIAGTNDAKLDAFIERGRPNFVHRSAWYIFQFLALVLAFVTVSGLMHYALGSEWHCFGDCFTWSLKVMKNMTEYDYTDSPDLLLDNDTGFGLCPGN